MSNTGRGAIGGGLLGAGVGALAGCALGDPGAGAAIGGAAGAGLGALAGAEQDHEEHIEQVRHENNVALVQAAQAQQAAMPRLSMFDVIRMTQEHASDDLIINSIQTSGSVFDLSTEDVLTLKRNGVSDRVVIEMQRTRARAPAPVVVAPAPPQREVIIHHQSPRPRSTVIFGVGSRPCGPRHYHYHHRHHCWP